jgi:hypothetical protein
LKGLVRELKFHALVDNIASAASGALEELFDNLLFDYYVAGLGFGKGSTSGELLVVGNCKNNFVFQDAGLNFCEVVRFVKSIQTNGLKNHNIN